MKLLVVDDDLELRELLQQQFEEHGIEVRYAEDAEEACRVLADEGDDSFEVILLEAKLRGLSGWQLLAQLRAGGNQTPVIFVTECGGAEERVKGLELGADDYVLKPVDFDELLARVGAVTRRRHAGVATVEAGGFRLDVARKQLDWGDGRVEMTAREFELLLALAEGAGRVFSRTELLRRVWNLDFDPGTNVVEVLVARVRRRLEGSGLPLIETVPGRGYRFRVPPP